MRFMGVFHAFSDKSDGEFFQSLASLSASEILGASHLDLFPEKRTSGQVRIAGCCTRLPSAFASRRRRGVRTEGWPRAA